MVQDASEKYTLLYPGLAREGYRFIFVGSTPQCEACRLQGVCLTNLEPGRLYEVVSLRDVVHTCAVHDNVVTVTVREPAFSVAIKPRMAIPGSTLTWNNPVCDHLLCEHYNTLCRPEYLQPGDRLHIKEKNGNLNCPKGEKLTKIEVTRLN
ncbi:MAG: UPF0179 family protein [Candidatus Heimdallarchaeota archaeon]